MRLGYARCSTKEQSVEIQIEELTKAGVERIYSEKVSGTKMENREELKALLITLRPGDEVYFTRIDRMARSVPDFFNIIRQIDAAGASLHILQQNIETKSSAGRLLMTMLAGVAQFETEIRRERQMEGIVKYQASRKNHNIGRGPSYDRAVIWHMHTARGWKPSKIAKEIGGTCTEWTVRRAIKQHGEKLEKEKQLEPQS